MTCPADRVPAHLIVKEIEEFIADDDQTVSATTRIGLFERAGVHESSYRKWIYGESSNILFDTADKLMTAMGKSFHWWANPELNDHYLRVNLTGKSWAEKNLTKREAMVFEDGHPMLPPRDCPWCGREFTAARMVGGAPTYCSLRCRKDRKNAHKRQRRSREAA